MHPSNADQISQRPLGPRCHWTASRRGSVDHRDSLPCCTHHVGDPDPERAAGGRASRTGFLNLSGSDRNQFLLDDGRDLRAEQLYRVHRLGVRNHAAIEQNRHSGDAAQRLVLREDLFRDGVRVAHEQGAGRSTCGVELWWGDGRPPSLFSDSIEELRVRRVEFVCSLFGGVGKKPDRMDAHIERFRRLARTPAGIPIKVDERAEAAGLAANDRNHQGNSKRADHADSRTTKFYDRRQQIVLREDVERIRY